MPLKDPEARAEYERSWRQANPDKVRAQGARRRQSPEYREAARLRTKKWVGENKERHLAGVVKWQREHPVEKRLNKIRSTCRKTGLPFNITIDDLLPGTSCPIFGTALNWNTSRGADDCAQVDRVVPSLGYVKGNVRVISARANRIKDNATAAELRLIADYIDRNTGHT